MATATVKMIPGAIYYAGFSKPFFVTEGMITSHLEGLGGKDVRFYDRDEQAPPVNPKTDPNATDNWDQWLSVRYDGEPKTVTETKHWAWAVRHLDAAYPGPNQIPTTPGAGVSPPTTDDSGAASKVTPEPAESPSSSTWLWVVAGLAAIPVLRWALKK